MRTIRFSCCTVVENDEIVVIVGLFTPYTSASGRGEAMAQLHDWFIDNKCRPYQEV